MSSISPASDFSYPGHSVHIPSPASSADECPSIEYGMGVTFALPFFGTSPRHDLSSLETSDEDAGFERFPFLEQFQVPLEERRRIPGSGINQHDLFDSPIRCETVPIVPQPARMDHSELENLFDQFDKQLGPEALFGKKKFVHEHFQKQQYGRSSKPVQRPQKYPTGLSNFISHRNIGNSENVLFSQRQRLPIRDPRYPLLSTPLSATWSISSSSSSSPPTPSSHSTIPLAHSTPLINKQRNMETPHSGVTTRHPRFIPTISSIIDTDSSPETGSVERYMAGSSSSSDSYLPESPIPGMSPFDGREFP